MWQKLRIGFPILNFEATGGFLPQNSLTYRSRQDTDAGAGVEDAHRPVRDVGDHAGHEIGNCRWRTEMPSLFPFTRQGRRVKAPLLFGSELWQFSESGVLDHC